MSKRVPVSLFFAYGVHLDHGLLREHCPGAEVFGLAKLEGHAVAVAAHGGLTALALARLERCGRLKKDSR